MKLDRSVRIASLVLAAVFTLMGAMKFIMSGMAQADFVRWGYPAWFAFVIGAAEIAAGVLLAIPRATVFGSGLAIVIMAGAIATHLRMPELGLIPLAAPLLAVSAFVAWRLRERMGMGAPRASP